MNQTTRLGLQCQTPPIKVKPDLEKNVNHPQAENSQVNNVLKIARFAKKDEQKYVYEILVWQDGILTY